MVITTLCFSSGGIQGISFIGALKFLHLRKYLDINNINKFVGTSAGAIFAFLLSINYTIDELMLLLLTYDFKSIEPDYDIDCMLNNFGIDNGEKIIKLFNKLLENKLNVIDITFNELYKITNKELIIIGTDFSNSCEKIFSYNTTPEISVILALRISISIPIIFTPILLNNNYYVDGALVNEFPLNLCDKNSTLGFRIINPKSFKLEKIQDIIFGTLCILSDKNIIKYLDYEFIKIHIYDTNISDFNIDNSYIKNLVKNGEYFAKKHLIYVYKKKIKEFTTNIIKNIIYEIIDKI